MRALMDTLSDASLCEDLQHGDIQAIADHQAAQQAFDETTQDLHAKLRAYVAYALELRVERQAREAYMDAIVANVLDKMRRANERDQKKEEWLLGRVKEVVEQYQVPMPLKCKEFTIALQKLPPSCEITNENALPTEYLRHIPAVAASTAPDKKRILADLKDGVVIPGANMSKATYKLVIK